MISEKMYELGRKKSVIRELFEYGKQRAEIIGQEHVFDFSIGNPNVPAPDSVKRAILSIIETMDAAAVHGYTSAQGAAGAREAVAESLNRRFDTAFRAEDLYLTAGAAASLSICLKALICSGDEIVVFAPFFPEYRCFAEAAGAVLKVVPARTKDFQIDFSELEKCLSERTKAVIVNSPNNPSGVVYSENTLRRLSQILEEKAAAYGHPVYLLSDEPYREIVYDGLKVSFLTKYYKNTLVCYSYSKSLSLPGERIGYILVPEEAEDSKKIYAAVCGAGRALGYVCAPSLMQRVLERCASETSDISVYEKNRELLYGGLTKLGYECVKPEGAFYLFPKALEPDAYAFCERAKKYDLLVVPGDDFGCPGHVRISYCVGTDTIKRAMPAFAKLKKEYEAERSERKF